MHWKAYVWLSGRSPFASEQMCVMQIASEQHTAHGIEYINSMPTLDNATYRYARSALQCLQIEPEYLAMLHDITEDDMKVAGDLTDEGRFNQRSDTLPWFWQIGHVNDSDGPRMQECMSDGPSESFT